MAAVSLLLAAALVAAAAQASFAAAPRASLPDIEDEVMCPICGTTLELSESPQAERERQLIRRLIDQGRTKEEIKQALVAEYGEDVLATPEDDGFDLAAWLVPLALGLAALGGLAVAATRVVRTRPTPPPPPADASDRARLDRDMARDEPR